MHAEAQLHPQTRRHLANKERLRTSAIKEFALHGLSGAKVSSIVANAQLAQPSFYRLWPSKEAAYQDIIDHTVKAWHTAAVLVFDDDVTWTSENLLAQMERGTLKLYEALTINLDLTTLVIRHQLHDPEQRETYVAILRPGIWRSPAQRRYREGPHLGSTGPDLSGLDGTLLLCPAVSWAALNSESSPRSRLTHDQHPQHFWRNQNWPGQEKTCPIFKKTYSSPDTSKGDLK